MKSSTRIAYLLYAVVLTTIVCVVPLVRAWWIWSLQESGLGYWATALTSEAQFISTLVIVAAGFSLGGFFGPIWGSPFKIYYSLWSNRSRISSFSGPLALSLTAAVLLCVGLLLVPLLAYSVNSLITLQTLAGFCLLVAVQALIFWLSWLIGQFASRVFNAVGTLAFVLLAAALFYYHLAERAAKPLQAISSLDPLFGLLTVSALIPVLTLVAYLRLTRTDLTAVVDKLLQTERAIQALSLLDGRAIGELYALPPRSRMRLSVITTSTNCRVIAVFLRSVEATVRYPLRTIIGSVLLLIAGGIIVVGGGLDDTVVKTALGAISGILAYLALDSFFDGFKHAFLVIKSNNLFGWSPRQGLLMQLLFPAAVTVLLVFAAPSLILLGELTKTNYGLITLAAFTLGLLLAKLVGLTRSNLPAAVQVPVPTPMGDVGILARLLWCLDGLILAGLCGAASLLIPERILFYDVVVGSTAAMALFRTRNLSEETELF